MPLSSAPSVTYAASGDILSSTSIAGGATNSTSVVDFTSSLVGGWVGVTNAGGGTVAATNGLRVDVFPALDSTPNYATVAMPSFTIGTTVSTTTSLGFFLGPGKYKVSLTNIDATNAVTATVTSGPTG